MDFGQVVTRRPAGLYAPKRTFARAAPSSCDEWVMCRIPGTFDCDQLMANGKLEINTTTVFGFTAKTCFTNCSWPRVMLSRSRPSRPSLGEVQGRVPPPSGELCQSCAMSGPQVGSFPTTTTATSEERADSTAVLPVSSAA